jgi:subtilase family serine protease
VHAAGVMPVSQPPLRQVLVPVAGQLVPMASPPITSVGGTQTIRPLTAPQVYAGSPSRRSGQSDALTQSAVQPTPPAPQNPTPDGQFVAAAHGVSMFTQTRWPETDVHANPAAQSAAVVHGCVQFAAPPGIP